MGGMERWEKKKGRRKPEDRCRGDRTTAAAAVTFKPEGNGVAVGGGWGTVGRIDAGWGAPGALWRAASPETVKPLGRSGDVGSGSKKKLHCVHQSPINLFVARNRENNPQPSPLLPRSATEKHLRPKRSATFDSGRSLAGS